MPLDINLGTAFDTTNQLVLTVNPWLGSALHVVQNDGNLVKAADVASPLDRQAFVKVTNTRIANVYNTLGKGSVPIGNQSSNTTGQSVFVELSATASKTVADVPVFLPVQARVELRLPNDGDLTDENIISLLTSAIACLVDPDGTIRVTDMMRGVLLPD